MARIQRVRVPAPAPRGLAAGQVQKSLAVIPRTHERDRLLFGLIASTGPRAGEALSLYVEVWHPGFDGDRFVGFLS